MFLNFHRIEFRWSATFRRPGKQRRDGKRSNGSERNIQIPVSSPRNSWRDSHPCVNDRALSRNVAKRTRATFRESSFAEFEAELFASGSTSCRCTFRRENTQEQMHSVNDRSGKNSNLMFVTINMTLTLPSPIHLSCVNQQSDFRICLRASNGKYTPRV